MTLRPAMIAADRAPELPYRKPSTATSPHNPWSCRR